MKCFVTGPVGRPGPCNREAVTKDWYGHPVCGQCAEDIKYVMTLIEYLGTCRGEEPMYPGFDWKVELAKRN